jgi:hypothetical protein
MVSASSTLSNYNFLFSADDNSPADLNSNGSPANGSSPDDDSSPADNNLNSPANDIPPALTPAGDD